MGHRTKNFHNDNMVRRGYVDAARRIQELFLAGRKEEAAAAVPDEFLDETALIGPVERIRERYKLWADDPSPVSPSTPPNPRPWSSWPSSPNWSPRRCDPTSYSDSRTTVHICFSGISAFMVLSSAS